MRVLVACEFSGIVRDAFIARGHNAWSCDLLPTDRPGNHIQDDVLKHLDDGWDLMIAHPPCTYHTVAGNKYFYHIPKKPNPDCVYLEARFKAREEGRVFVRSLYDAKIEKIAIENPVGTLAIVIGKPDQIIQPYMFGHDYSKKTCLWLKNIPKLIPWKKEKWIQPRVVYNGDWFNYRWANQTEKSGNDTSWNWKIRSTTFQGIADAMAEQWG